MGDNGQKEDKKCPFGLECDKCRLFNEMTNGAGAGQRKFGLCSFNATVMILSEMNMKTQLPQQKIQIPPNILRG